MDSGSSQAEGIAQYMGKLPPIVAAVEPDTVLYACDQGEA